VKARLLAGFLALCAMLGIQFCLRIPQALADTGPSCGEHLYTNDQGIQIRVLWAKNGAVQRYDVVNSHNNVEEVNNMREVLVKTYGPEGMNAPPLQILSFKKAKSGSLMVPDKAVDSCGRQQSFQAH
jgi:hypothetical protein